MRVSIKRYGRKTKGQASPLEEVGKPTCMGCMLMCLAHMSNLKSDQIEKTTKQGKYLVPGYHSVALRNIIRSVFSETCFDGMSRIKLSCKTLLRHSTSFLGKKQVKFLTKRNACTPIFIQSGVGTFDVLRLPTELFQGFGSKS